MTATTPDRPEPTGCTLADLIALTFGAAMATSLDWYSHGVSSNWIGWKLAPGWYTLANQGIELIQKGCVALVPVILARRMRYGGPFRPVEYLPMLISVFLVTFSFSRWPVFGLFYPSPNPPHGTLVHSEMYFVWELSEFALGALAALVVLIRERKAADWISGIALAIAWQLVTTWLCYLYQQWANEQLMHLPAPIYVALGSTFLISWPQMVLGYLPMMIAIIDLARPHQRRMTWVVAAAMVIALPMPIIYDARTLTRMALDPGNGLFDAIRMVGKLLAIVASFALARRFEPSWRWFLEGSAANPV